MRRVTMVKREMVIFLEMNPAWLHFEPLTYFWVDSRHDWIYHANWLFGDTENGQSNSRRWKCELWLSKKIEQSDQWS